MLLQGMDIARFIQVYIVQGIFGFFYVCMAVKILIRDRKNLNVYLSMFFLSVGIGVFINIIYANLYEENIVLLLHFITYYLFCLAMIFLLIFVTVLLKSEQLFGQIKQLTLIFIYSCALLILWFIPDGITINESTDWKPVWSWTFCIYSLIICSVLTIIPTILYTRKIYEQFKNEHLKKKWQYFRIGILAYFFIFIGTTLSNTLNIPSIRLIWSIASLPTLITVYLVYYGIVRQVE